MAITALAAAAATATTAIVCDEPARRSARQPMDARPARWREARVVLEDLALQFTKLRTRLEPELFREPSPAGLVGGERLRLAPRSVESKHQ